MKLPLSLLFFFSVLLHGLAQDSTQPNNTLHEKEAITLLSEGTLVVRLSKSEQNIDVIEAFEGKTKAQHERARIIQANKNLIREFEKDYTFSDVVFAYDVDLFDYLQGVDYPIFLDSELETDPKISIKKEPLFILSSTRNRVYQIYNKDYKPIGKNSPVYFNNHYKIEYQFALAKAIQSMSNLFIKRKNVAYLNKKLFSQLEKTT